MINFKEFESAHKGQIADLLKEIYKTVSCKDNEYEDNIQYRRELDERLSGSNAVEKENGFLTYLNDELIGMCCWVRLNSGNEVKLRDNGIIEKYTGKGYGKMQIFEMIKRLQNKQCTKIYVTTGDNVFYNPARKMYISCGFSEIKREEKYGNKLIHYQKILT